jgi:hypothetical protein
LGPVPIGVVWFGALGAVLISLAGVFEHEKDWDDAFWPWHLSRPLIGISVAVVSVLIMKAGILAVGFPSNPPPTQVTARAAAPNTPSPAEPKPAAPNPPTAPNSGSNTPPASGTSSTSPAIPPNLLYYIVAFLVGYREETFRELIKRLVDIILVPGSTTTGLAPSIRAANPNQAPHNTSTDIVITGSGFTGTRSVNFGTDMGQVKPPVTDGQITVTTPVVAAAGPVSLTVTTKNGSASTQFTFT